MADLPSTLADGNVKVAFVPAIANPDAPTTAEVTAGTDMSCYLTADGWNPGLDEATVADDRLCDTQTYERRGRVSRTLTIRYVENPGDATNNAAFTTLAPGTSGFFVVRRGSAYDAAFAATQKVDVWPVEAGEYNELPPEANSVLRVEQRMFVRGPKRTQVAVAA